MTIRFECLKHRVSKAVKIFTLLAFFLNIEAGLLACYDNITRMLCVDLIFV